MTRALALTEKQARTLIRAAGKEHAVIEVKVGDTVFRLIPADLAQASGSIDETINPANFQTLDEWDAWKERKRAREAQGRS